MTHRTTRWSTDCCDCILEYSWDDDLADSEITHSLSNVVSKCPAHAALSNGIELWNMVVDENKKKNSSLQVILDNGPERIYDVKDYGDGNHKMMIRVLKAGIHFNFSYSGKLPEEKRVLSVSLTVIRDDNKQEYYVQFSNEEKNAIIEALDTQFGKEEVVFNNG